jgi:Glucose / Sorbosone dehydrogenase
LRNSMAIAVHPSSGLVLQAENSADYPGDAFPPDELNIVEKGRHYGWPYCVGRGTPTPEYRRYGVDCSRYTGAAALLPAHSAPLGMLFYSGTLFPELSNNLIISYHGYRRNGQRIVAALTDHGGLPQMHSGSFSLDARELVGPWVPERGVRPLGSPVGLALAADGSLWFVEDKNRTVMVILRSEPANHVVTAKTPDHKAPQVRLAPAVDGWNKLYREVIHVACAKCHDEFSTQDATNAWRQALERGWLNLEDLSGSKIFRSMLGADGLRPMPPPPSVLRQEARSILRRFLANLQERSPMPKEN